MKRFPYPSLEDQTCYETQEKGVHTIKWGACCRNEEQGDPRTVMMARHTVHCALQSPARSPSCSKPDRDTASFLHPSFTSHLPPSWDLLCVTQLIVWSGTCHGGPQGRSKAPRLCCGKGTPALAQHPFLCLPGASSFKFQLLPSQVQDVVVIPGAGREAVPQLSSEVLCTSLTKASAMNLQQSAVWGRWRKRRSLP